MILSKVERVRAKCEALIVAGKIYGQTFSQEALCSNIPIASKESAYFIIL